MYVLGQGPFSDLPPCCKKTLENASDLMSMWTLDKSVISKLPPCCRLTLGNSVVVNPIWPLAGMASKLHYSYYPNLPRAPRKKDNADSTVTYKRVDGLNLEEVAVEKDQFFVNLDVQQFMPAELSIKITGDIIIVEGKHEEKPDQHGTISRYFKRKYVVPKGHDISRVEAHLSRDGVLSIIENKPKEHRRIPVIHTHKTWQ